MTIATEHTDWQASDHPMTSSCSPNLILVLAEVRRRWPAFTNLGCYGRRPVRGSTTVPSTHSWGAAVDIGYPAEMDELVAAEVCPWIVARSDELHVGAVHDYRRCRIWHAGRTGDVSDACTSWWKAQRASSSTGMGQAWANHLHLEVQEPSWYDSTPMPDRWADWPA